MPPPDAVPRIDAELLWTAAAVAAGTGAILVIFLTWRIPRERFRRLAVPLVLVSTLFWTALYTWAFWTFWDSCYGYIFPAWARWVWPPYGLLSGAGLGLLFWYLALLIPGEPVPNLALLGGLHSLPGHALGIFGRGLLERCPILEGVTPAPAFVFGFFEFLLYWSVILSLALLARIIADRDRRPGAPGG